MTQIPLPFKQTEWGKRTLKRKGKGRKRPARPNPVTHLLLPIYGEDEAELEETLREYMHVDDALICEERRLRLEYVYLQQGYPHYRLYRRGALYGIANVTTPHKARDVQRNMVMVLTAMGFTPENTRLRKCGARTPIELRKDHMPYFGFANFYSRLLQKYVVLVCEHCGVRFTRRSWQIKPNGNRVFCSPACASAARRKAPA